MGRPPSFWRGHRGSSCHSGRRLGLRDGLLTPSLSVQGTQERQQSLPAPQPGYNLPHATEQVPGDNASSKSILHQRSSGIRCQQGALIRLPTPLVFFFLPSPTLPAPKRVAACVMCEFLRAPSCPVRDVLRPASPIPEPGAAEEATQAGTWSSQLGPVGCPPSSGAERRVRLPRSKPSPDSRSGAFPSLAREHKTELRAFRATATALLALFHPSLLRCLARLQGSRDSAPQPAASSPKVAGHLGGRFLPPHFPSSQPPRREELP